MVDETWPKGGNKIVHNQGVVQAQAGGNEAQEGGFLLVLLQVLGVRVRSLTVGKAEGASTDFESDIDGFP